MGKMDVSGETRISVRLSGPLADHANRRVDSALYSTHSEYIRDLIRRDMQGERGDIYSALLLASDQIDQRETVAESVLDILNEP